MAKLTSQTATLTDLPDSASRLTAGPSGGLSERMEALDRAAVAQVLAGDRDAFGALVHSHSRAIFALAYRMTGNSEDADEVVQETFMRAYKSLDRFEQRSNFGTWLYRIAVNRALDLIARRKSRPQPEYTIAEDPEAAEREMQVSSERPDPERQLMSREAGEKIATAIRELSPKEQIAFRLRHMEGRSIAEIAEAMEIKEEAAKNTVFRAVKKLRATLQPLVGAR